MADASQMRRKLSQDTYGSSVKAYATELAAQTNAVAAINADLYLQRDLGITVYNRQLQIAPVPIVNAGDGANQHPSQTMLDLYSIYKTQGTLDNLQIHLIGDLKYGRTVHSMLTAMRHFNPTFHFIAPEELAMPEQWKQYCHQYGINYVEHTDFDQDTIAEADILYMTRVQKERFTDLMEYERVKDRYLLKLPMLAKAKPNMKILHPLPRVNEIEYSIDDDPHAYYFEQARNGLYARQALICDSLGITLDEVVNDKTIIK